MKYITLVNLLTADELFPKDLTPYDPVAAGRRGAVSRVSDLRGSSPQIAGHVIEWLTDRPARQALVDRLERLKTEVGHGGAARTAANYIVDTLEALPRPTLRTHFIPPVAAERPATAELEQAA